MIACVVFLVLASFYSFKSTQAAHVLTFISPFQGQTFIMGSEVNVQIGGTFQAQPVQVSQICGDTEPTVIQNLTSPGYSANFQLPTTYLGQCRYIAADQFTSSEIFITVVPEQLVIASPLDGSELTIGVPFNVLVTTQDGTASSPITLAFTEIASQNISGTTNVQQSVTLDSSYLGSDSLAVTATDPYTDPDPISIVLKYGLEFTVAPTFIVKGVPFDIFLKTSDVIVNPATSTIQVSLTCGSSIIKSWAGVPLNQLTTLSAVSNDSNSDQSNCILSTEANNQFYFQASASVLLVSSPFGGQLQPITHEQQAAFAISIAFPPSEIMAL